MPNIGVKLYSLYFKLLLKHRLQCRDQNPSLNPFGVTSRHDEEPRVPSNPSFSEDGIAAKDIHIDPLTSLSIRIFLPNPNPRRNCYCDGDWDGGDGGSASGAAGAATVQDLPLRRCSHGGGGPYKGYLPSVETCLKQTFARFPVAIQFHGGGFVFGSNDSVANDVFCRRIARQCEAIVVAVGYRLAPESRYPAAFDDGLKVLHWLGKQANLAECGRSMGCGPCGGEARRLEGQRHVLDAFGAGMVEPWLAAHADLSRCILLGVSCGANIADFVSRKAVEAGRLLAPVKIVAQVLICPFFIGSTLTRSELNLANSYFYDKKTCLLAWKLFLPQEEFSLDHPAANPLAAGRGPPLKCMPPTLTVVAEHDWMKDQAIAYSEDLRKVNVDAPVLEYKDAVHEFATLEILLKTPQAQACVEDIAIWVKKYISTRGHELSY